MKLRSLDRCLSVGKGLSLTSVLFVMNAECAGVNYIALLGLQQEMDILAKFCYASSI